MLFVTLSAYTVSTLYAQQTTFADEAPMVSRLRLAIRDPQIRITWEDAQRGAMAYRILRAVAPITDASYSDSLHVATVDPGEQGYIDAPAEPGSYYYAVVAVRPDRSTVPIIVPGRNASFRPVTIVRAASQAEPTAVIQSIEAIVVTDSGRDAIEISMTANREGDRIAVYRATSPITSVDELDDATLVREVVSGTVRLIDLPVPGVHYYYAAVDTAALLAGRAVVSPGENATREPAEIPLGTVVDARATLPATDDPGELEPPRETLRSRPLPTLRLQTQLETGTRLHDPRITIPEPARLDPETERRIADLILNLGTRPPRPNPPRILPPDLMPEPEGAEYTLRTIIDGPLAQMAWETALLQLGNLLTLPLTADLRARVHFYRAVASYEKGSIQHAILEFLLAREFYYPQVERWLAYILTPDDSDPFEAQ